MPIPARTVLSRGTCAASLLVGVALAGTGCEQQYPSYPADMSYGVRTEPILSNTLAGIPPRIDKPGELDQILSEVTDEKDRTNIFEPSKLGGDQRRDLEDVLEGAFGTPADPKADAAGVKGMDEGPVQALANARQALQLDKETLARGSAYYRVQCLHCHGLPGNGRGPTAPWVNPHPRDYRQGLFKFTSSNQPITARKPRREDLRRTIRSGIEGTSMPPFALLPEEEIQAIISYVIHLSMRGQVEFQVMLDLLRGESKDVDVRQRAGDYLEQIANQWVEAQGALIRPDANAPLPTEGEARAASIKNGYRLFRETSAAGCIGCHKDYGRQAAYFYDAWGTIGRPADLTQDVYRGGRRPIDLFWRIHSGVGGSNMPQFSNLLQTKDIWDLINFLEVLPYPKMRQKYGIDIDTPAAPPSPS